MGSKLDGTEVPIIGSDSVKWLEVCVPSTPLLPSPTAADPTPALPPPFFAPPTQDAASCSVIGNPPTYLIWRVHKDQPNALEIVEICDCKEFPSVGLRIVFPDALCPFAFFCKDEIKCASGNPYLLYALTVSGVAYLIRLKNFYNYASCSVFPPNEIIELNIQSYPHYGGITAVAAISGCLVIGRNDGSVGCFQLGVLDPSLPGFVHELREDAGLGRLWGFVSWNRTVAAVQDLVISDVYGKRLLFVLHSDGILRVWDLLSRSRIFSQTISVATLAGVTLERLWVREADNSTSTIHFAVLYKQTSEFITEQINIYSLHFSLGDKTILLLEPSIQTIPLEEGGLIDVKLTSNKIWMLKEDGFIMQELFGTNVNGGVAHCYSLQDAFVADQLFQSPEHSSDDLLWLAYSIFSSLKDQIVLFLSSIFLRRLLLPGVHHNAVLRATFQDYNKHLTDSEFHSLTVDGLKKEILSLIEHEGVSENPVSVLYCWKTFCSRYFHNWCKNNAPFGMLIDSSTGAIGLIRKKSISLFRRLEDIELLSYGSFDQLGDFISSGLGISVDSLECEILLEVLRCLSNISQQLGKAVSAIYYESLLSAPIVSSEEVVPRLLKILETGHSSSLAALHVSDLGTDIAWEKEVAGHKNLRKFSIEMFLSFHALCNKATTWAKVLKVIESYLKFLVPCKIIQKIDSEVVFSINTSLTVQATSQVAKVMFESALDILLLLNYLVNVSGQIRMLPDDISKIQLELVPMIQEIITEWHIIHFFGTTPSESPAIEDFSSQLSSLQIDGKADERSWNKMLGKCDFKLAFILLLSARSTPEDQNHLSSRCHPNPSNIILSVKGFTSWLIWGMTGEASSAFFSHSTELALILLRHGQYDAVEYLLNIVEAHSQKEKTSGSIQSDDGKWFTILHLLGCCLLAQAHCGSPGILKDRKVREAVRCFFRASSVQGAPQALQRLTSESWLPHFGFTGCLSSAAWKLHYYQWAMQIFEQYNMSEGACQFALAALEQVDEALGHNDDSHGAEPLNESATTVRGRLWGNVFKFTLDLNYYYDAYCAIISNPDEESKYMLLRRFIIVLYERGAIKTLCDGQLPLIDLTEKVERELAWKAERTDVSAKPNPLKLLYAFEMHRHNWRRAASYIYLYSAQLRTEAALKDHQKSLILQERLNGLSAAINALHLVHPAYAWIDPPLEEQCLHKAQYPTGNDVQHQRLQNYLDIEKLENEFVLTSVQYLLSLANVKWNFTGNEKPPPDLVDQLIQANFYDMAFTVLLKFWKGSGLKRGLERVFIAMSLKCCPNRAGPSLAGNDLRTHGLLLTSSNDEMVVDGSLDIGPSTHQSKGNSQWETLELYLEKYKGFHPRLPVIVAETLLRADPQIELPLWLVRMFKGAQRESTWGMTGEESDPASLFRLYVEYARYAEATNLLVEYIEAFALVRPADIIRRKRPSAVWFPYAIVEQLWCRLEELISSGHMIDQCRKLKKLLHGALLNHLNLLKVDSDDVQSSASVEKLQQKLRS
ncbi:nuclear pore complex protein NUP160 isoform X2 [Cornus florida]|uniref:nuclear pore complex protein NUP160 isoform X2 n=1 Tax=Cornus florida TaxID=4283 RepID=UPI00289AE120|nr:nuclear pore complex protein NUP160 isoform X2 [Cornus florida]